MHDVNKPARSAIALLLCLCAMLGAATPVSAERINVNPFDQTAPAAVRGAGSLEYLPGSGRMSGTQEQLVLDYLHAHYSSLAALRAQELADFYAADALDEAAYAQAILDVLIGVRSMQQTDLSLTDYCFELRVQSVKKQSDGGWKVMAFEDSVQCFTAYPGTQSQTYDMGHSFVLTETARGWRLAEHRKGDSMYNTLMSRDSGASTAALREQMLSGARADVGRRASRGSAVNLTADNEYDRAAAVSYARRWATGTRNSSRWPTYDRYGGNCMNFVSQALFAGGIPMDTVSPGIWKWYGNTPNTNNAASGRSASWSGCQDFYNYVRTNQGYGLVAKADAPYYSGEVGDIIHMGTSSRWTHTVMITSVIRDADGNVIDYLVASNTSNLTDYPASAYYYTNQMLIKVVGWNNEASDESQAAAPSADNEPVYINLFDGLS